MRQILDGRMSEKATVRTIEREGGETFKVANFTMFVHDPRGPEVTLEDGSEVKKGIPVPCTAWGKAADEIEKLNKGDRLTATASMHLDEWEKDGQKYQKNSYTIRTVDHDHEIGEQINKLINDYDNKYIDNIYEGKSEKQPDFTKDRSKQQDKSVEKAVNKDVQMSKDDGKDR